MITESNHENCQNVEGSFGHANQNGNFFIMSYLFVVSLRVALLRNGPKVMVRRATARGNEKDPRHTPVKYYLQQGSRVAIHASRASNKSYYFHYLILRTFYIL
ncbi:MAG: hypothetical protein H6Q52_1524 [Deltaproteobacteria bacterium]|nr:hypothetical protein [Deltaproteobacteria bacterium]